ncbi:MAG: 3'-5' exonuclease [Chromatiales bacterium]|nr:3'-5' exonuclease [Chromatiales bacterium]
MSNFVAIDFETAAFSRASACAIGMVHVQDQQIVEEKILLIRPPSSEFRFTHIHGLTWNDVRNQRTFMQHWDIIEDFIHRGDFLVAHNASFDRGVLGGCCEHYDLPDPRLPFVCTVQLARRQWDIRPTRLPDVCHYLGIELQHHDAASDSRACAKIVIAAEQDGWQY